AERKAREEHQGRKRKRSATAAPAATTVRPASKRIRSGKANGCDGRKQSPRAKEQAKGLSGQTPKVALKGGSSAREKEPAKEKTKARNGQTLKVDLKGAGIAREKE
ncbi:unnamed protein product, partial [Laminaria digitata]